MDVWFSLTFSAMAGGLLGGCFFGGMWWTISRGLSSPRAALWFMVSMLLRTGIVVLGFYFILGGDWERLLAGLLGFSLARLIVTRLMNQHIPLMQEASHAP